MSIDVDYTQINPDLTNASFSQSPLSEAYEIWLEVNIVVIIKIVATRDPNFLTVASWMQHCYFKAIFEELTQSH